MIELKIVLDDNGNVQVSGNVDVTYHCYAMLETARDLIHKRWMERDRVSTIVPATGEDVRTLTLTQ